MKKFRIINLAWLLILAVFTFSFTACEDEEDPKIPVEDGLYIFGAGTAVTDYDISGLLKATKNEVGQADRAGLVEIYIAVKAGTDGFNLGKVVGGKAKVYGPSADFVEVLEAEKISDEPRGWFSRGTLEETNTKFTVPEDGLYHIVYDETLNKVVVARVEWGIIGGATANGWGGSTALPLDGTFDLNAMTFKVTDFILTAGDFKFRYSNGWKIVLDGELVRVNTNFGGAVNALVPGGDNIANTVVGKYTVKVMWTLTAGTTAEVTKTGDYTPPTYPEAMYIVGDATAYGWDTPGTVANAIMHKCAGGAPTEGIFWKICYIETAKGFKLSNANWGNVNLGFADVSEFDASGQAVTDNGGNMQIGTSGLYMVVLNLRDNLKKVSIKPAVVYGIGDCFGGFTEDVAGNIFTLDGTGKILTSPALAANGNIRMYADHAWIPSWWQAEFRVAAGAIEYRNDGGDQEAVAGTTGQVITLTFDTNVGAIAK